MDKNKIIVNNDISEDSKYLIYTPIFNDLPFCITGAGHFKAHDKYLVNRSGLNMYLLIYTLAGEGEVEYNEYTYTVREKDIFLFDASNYHRYNTSKNNYWEFKWIRFTGASADPYIKYINGNDKTIKIFSVDSVSLEKYFDCVINMLENQTHNIDFLLCNQLSSLLTDLHMSNIEDYSFHKTGNAVSKAKQYLTDNYKSDISVNALAEMYFMNPFTFIRNFKRQVGITPYAFLLRARINESKLLLEKTTMPIYEIASEVGFQDINCFIRIFKSAMQITPSQYRKMLNEFDKNY